MKTIFWNVDTQYDFMRSDGKLYVPGGEGIEGNLAKLTKFANEKGYQVVNSADWHNDKSKEISDNPDFVRSFPQHCMQYTKGAEFVEATNPKDAYVIDWKQGSFDEERVKEERNVVLYKDKFDVFSGNPNTGKLLKIIKPDRAIVYGVATNVCVDFAVKGLLERRIDVYVVEDAIKELPNMDLPFKEWENLGAKLLKTSEVEEILK